MCRVFQEVRSGITGQCDGSLLVGDEDVKGVDHIDERSRLVRLPLVDSLFALSHENEVVVLALEVDLDLFSVSANHDDECGGLGW